MCAPHCLSTKRQADIVASLGTHMTSGNPIEVVPLRATTGLCGGAVHSATVPLSRFVARKQFATTKLFAFDFPFFSIFESFALYNAMGPHCLWPGMTPVSGRRPQAGVASIVLPDEAARLEGTLGVSWPRANSLPCTTQGSPPSITPEHIIIGTTTRGLSSNVPVTVDPVARARHTVIFGQTGTGKSVLLRNICAQIAAQRGGFAFVDPHGENAEAIVSLIPADRADEFVYVDLAVNDNFVGINFLDGTPPDKRATAAANVVAAFVHIFGKEAVGDR